MSSLPLFPMLPPPKPETDTAVAIILPAVSVPALPAEDIRRAVDFAVESKAESTRRAYRSDFAAFTAWCASRGVDALPASPETVAAFLAAEADAGKKPSTIGRRCAAIGHAHKLAGLEPPTNSEMVKATLGGIRRAVGAAPNRKAPAVATIVKDMVRAAPADRMKGLRDRALFLLGYGGMFRRSELVALNVEDIEFTEDGLKITIRKSKTDQEGHGVTIGVKCGGADCPMKALRAWLHAGGIMEGAIFRPVRKGGQVRDRRLTANSVCVLIKHYAAKIGLDASKFGAHSLRSGPITDAANRGASVWKIQEVSRHKSVDVLAGYVRNADLFKDHCLAGVL